MRNSNVDLRLWKRIWKENQRVLCLEELVELALCEEELGKMNKPWSTTYMRVYWWIQVMGGHLMQCLAILLLLQIKTVRSSLPNHHCPQRLHRSLDASGWYALGRGWTQCYLWPRIKQVYQVGVGVLGCLVNPWVRVKKKKVIGCWEEMRVRNNRVMCEAPAVFNKAKRVIKDVVDESRWEGVVVFFC